ncbi:MAG: trigger factor [Chlamydiae bacterium]|nr:MAG: trigger factor [Chlamydiota bacterium]
MSIKAKLKTKTPCEVILECEVSREKLDAAYEQAFKEQNKYIPVAGFRPGKAPRELVEKKYKKEIQSYALEDMIKKIIDSVIKQNRLEPITGASMEEEVTFPEDGELKFTVEFEVAPAVKLPDYKNLKLTKRKSEITDDDVKNTLEKLIEQHSTLEDITDNRPAVFGDWLIVDYVGTANGEEAFNRKDAWIEVNSDRKIPMPGFPDKLVGAKIGETLEFDLDAPSDFAISKVAGKKVNFSVEIKSIREMKKPELTDELAVKINPKCKTVDELKKNIEENQLKYKVQEENRRLKELAVEEILRTVKIPLPPSQVNSRVRNLVESEARQRMQAGETEEQIKGDIENIQKKMAEVAEQQLRKDYLLDSIARAEKIKVTEQDIMPQLYYYAQTFRKPLPWVYKMFERNGRIRELYAVAANEKALDIIIEAADIKEK